MSGWKKVITSGSAAELSSLYAPSITGSLLGTASYANSANSASYSLTSSYAVSSSYASTSSLSERTIQTDVLVLNQTGFNISKGTVVRITGSNNASDIPRINTASYENDNNSANTLGITTQAINNGAQGYVITEGVLLGIDTSNYTSGQLIYLGATGSITGSAPQAPLHAVRLGEVIRQQSNAGSIYISINNGYEIEELHDVLIISASSGDLLVRDGNVWNNTKQLTGSYGLTGSLTATSFTGSLQGPASYALTASYVQNAISSSFATNALTASYVANAFIQGGNSFGTTATLGTNDTQNLAFETNNTTRIFVSSSGNVGIGITTPSVPLHIKSTAIPSTNEPILRLEVSDSPTAYLSFNNASTTDGEFVPEILGRQGAPSNQSAIYQGGYIDTTQDSGNTPVTVFRSAKADLTPVSTRPLFDFRNWSTSQMIISADGKVGIGTSSPTARLTIVTTGSDGGAYPTSSGTTQVGYITRLRNGGSNLILDIGGFTTNGSWLQATNQTDLSLTYPILLNPNGGNVAIGKNTPNAKLDVSGSALISGSLTVTGSFNASSYSNKILSITEVSKLTLISHSIGTTNFTAINLNSDGTNRYAKASFVAPLSGQVQITMEFDMIIVNSAAVQMIGLHNTSSATSTPSEGWYRVNADNDSTSGQFYASFIKTGLTPGTTYNYYFMGVCDFSGNLVRASAPQTGSYVASSDLPSPLRIYVYDLGTTSITSNPST